jgi:hypothetical protein
MTQTANAVQPSSEAVARAREMNAALQEAVAADAFVQGQASELDKLEERVTQLRLKVNNLETRRNQIGEQYDRATNAERPRLATTIAEAQHDLTAAKIELDMANKRYERVLAISRSTPEPKIATVGPPPMDPFKQDQIKMIETGAFELLIPLVLTFARRLWIRGRPSVTSIDLESSPRLQRIEQAIESIAIEVERIGEAQRFTTKVLSERQVEPLAGHIPPAQTARREPGTITPH